LAAPHAVVVYLGTKTQTMNEAHRTRLLHYGSAIVAVAFATLLRLLLDPVLGDHSPYSTYFLAIIVTAWYAGFGPALFAVALGALAADDFFITPRGSIFVLDWVAYDLEHQVSLLLYIFVGVVMGILSESLKASQRRTEAARAELADANRSLEKEIAERKQAERWLLESESRFRGYFEQGLVGMAILSADKGWLETNPRLRRLLGYSEEDLAAKTWRDVTHPEDWAVEEPQFDRMLGGVTKGYVLDKRFLGKDGNALYTIVSVQCMRKEDGQLDCVLALVQDMTDRKRAEEAARVAEQELFEEQQRRSAQVELELVKVKDELVRQTRLAAVGQIAASIAHDLRNPLAAVRYATFLLRRHVPPDQPKCAQYVEMIDQEIGTANQVIDNLMETARGKPPQTKSIDLGELVHRVFDRLEQGNDVRLRAQLNPQPFVLAGDPVQFAQVFGNLMSNAIQAMSGRGEIRVQACREGDKDCIVFEDDGPGIPEDLRDHIFEPLVTGKPKGTGLGLAICRQIIERHAGTIHLLNSANGGAAFRICLPSPAAQCRDGAPGGEGHG
jgi:PAS domain S-box-containing protein